MSLVPKLYNKKTIRIIICEYIYYNILIRLEKLKLKPITLLGRKVSVLCIVLLYIPIETQNSSESRPTRFFRISESKPRSAPRLFPARRVPKSGDTS